MSRLTVPIGIASADSADGTQDESAQAITLRPIRPGDAARLVQFGESLSRESRYQRFFSLRGFLPGEVKRLTVLDPLRDAALVATVKVEGKAQIIGVARYAGEANGATCDIAVVIADAWQHHGLGRTLLAGVLEVARTHGFGAATGVVLATNYGMQRLALRLGFTLRRDPRDPTVLNLYKPLHTDLH
jgi:acetyltransferase